MRFCGWSAGSHQRTLFIHHASVCNFSVWDQLFFLSHSRTVQTPLTPPCVIRHTFPRAHVSPTCRHLITVSVSLRSHQCLGVPSFCVLNVGLIRQTSCTKSATAVRRALTKCPRGQLLCVQPCGFLTATAGHRRHQHLTVPRRIRLCCLRICASWRSFT